MNENQFKEEFPIQSPCVCSVMLIILPSRFVLYRLFIKSFMFMCVMFKILYSLRLISNSGNLNYSPASIPRFSPLNSLRNSLVLDIVIALLILHTQINILLIRIH